MQRGNEPEKVWRVWTPFFLSLAVVIGMLAGFRLQDTEPAMLIKRDNVIERPSFSTPYDVLEELVRYAEVKYVDAINRDELIETAVNNFLKELDPHSIYISEKDLKQVNEELDGSFEGIGIEFVMIDDTIVVVTPIEGGPSEAVGILPGDRLVEIEDTLLFGEASRVRDIVSRLKGKKGTAVEIGVLRGREKVVRHYDIVREEIPLNSIDAAYMLNEDVAYIKMNRFSATTYKEFIEAADTLTKKHGMKHLVLDLRQNPGGYLQEATKLLNQFFKQRDRLLVYTEGHHVRRNDYHTTGKNFFDIDQVAVLIDEGSASASEIVAGALQDWDRGVIIGRRSFGKGLVQEQYPLKNGGALRLTVARYYTPTGRSIQKPYKGLGSDYDHDLVDRMKNGEFSYVDSIHLNDTTQFFTSGGRVVYGGGGITPDIFIPIDTALSSEYYRSAQNFITEFIYKNKLYIDSIVPANPKEFLDDFEVGEDLMARLIDYLKLKEAKMLPPKPSMIDERNMAHLLKANIAKRFYSKKAFYQNWNTDDVMVGKAVKAIKSGSPLTFK